jgi:hypothetical protein
MSLLLNLLSMFFEFFGKVLLVLLVCLVPIFFIGLFQFLFYYIFKGLRIPKHQIPPSYHRRSFIVRIFWDFPKRFVLDLFNKDPDRYTDTGIYIFEGEQGAGKTLAAIEYIYRQCDKYPLATFSSNIDVVGQKECLQGLESVIDSDNGIYGQINLIDEVQNWLNSNESKNVPVEFIGEICQQRKQAKQIIGTTQRFNRMSKSLRQETSLLFRPMTFLGCLTIVRVYKPNVDSDGEIKKMRHMRTYFFVHSDELRDAYDTFAKVKRLNLKGFKPKSERIGDDESTSYAPTVVKK